MRRGAFTLVEMLVVVAIIAALVAILAPGLGVARGNARAVVCRANLHQVGIATQMYLQDNDQTLWRYYVTEADGRRWWFGFEANGPGSGTHRPLDQTRGALYAYLRSTNDQLECPDFDYGNDFYPKFEERAATYGYNLNIGPASASFRTAMLNDIDRPAGVFAFADAIHFDHNPGYNEGHYILRAPITAKSGYAHFRHRDNAHLLMMDMHVEAQALVGDAHTTAGGGPAGNLTSDDGTKAIDGPAPKRK